jgi:GntR family transcriptional regulator
VAMFDQFAVVDGVPIYLQLIRQLRRGIAAGEVTDGEELPSRRMLSAELGVNPATVQKAYRLLEEEGLVTSHTGAKSYISVTPERSEAIRRELFEEEVHSCVRAMRQMGMTQTQAQAMLDKLWEEMT